MLDVSRLIAYSKEHDRIHSVQMEVVKNINCGKDFDEDGISKGRYSFWDGGSKYRPNAFTYSVSIPASVALTGYTTPDMSDGGYQHPISASGLDDMAASASSESSWCGTYYESGKREENYAAVWDSPRHGSGLRYGFTKLSYARKFIKELRKNFEVLKDGY